MSKRTQGRAEQRRANRENAKHSTGPIFNIGKAIISPNLLTAQIDLEPSNSSIRTKTEPKLHNPRASPGEVAKRPGLTSSCRDRASKQSKSNCKNCLRPGFPPSETPAAPTLTFQHKILRTQPLFQH